MNFEHFQRCQRIIIHLTSTTLLYEEFYLRQIIDKQKVVLRDPVKGVPPFLSRGGGGNPREVTESGLGGNPLSRTRDRTVGTPLSRTRDRTMGTPLSRTRDRTMGTPLSRPETGLWVPLWAGPETGLYVLHWTEPQTARWVSQSGGQAEYCQKHYLPN